MIGPAIPNLNILGTDFGLSGSASANGNASSRGGGTSANGGSSFDSSGNTVQAKNDDLTPDAEDNLISYLNGLLASVGESAELDRSFNSAQAEINRQFQASEAEKQRKWYELMAGSAYQRAMGDLRAAGLNPILAYSQGGAAVSGTSVPSGSAASHSTPSGDTLTSILNAIANIAGAINGGSAQKLLSNYLRFKK